MNTFLQLPMLAPGKNTFGLPPSALILNQASSEEHIHIYLSELLNNRDAMDMRLVDLEQHWQDSNNHQGYQVPRDLFSHLPVIEQFLKLILIGKTPPPEILLVIADCFQHFLEDKTGRLSLDQLLLPNSGRGKVNYRQAKQKNEIFRNFEHFCRQVELNGLYLDKGRRLSQPDKFGVFVKTPLPSREDIACSFLIDICNRRTPETFLRDYDRYVKQRKTNEGVHSS